AGDYIIDLTGGTNLSALAPQDFTLFSTAADDSLSILSTSIGTLNVLDNDSSASALTVTAVNGNSAAVDHTITLASGAKVTLAADGSLSYDTNHAFDSLAAGATATDSFTYTNDQGDTATVNIAIKGALLQPFPSSVDLTALNGTDGFKVTGIL